MRAFVRSYSRLSGWRRLLCSMLAGALSAGSLPPVGAWPILFFSVPAVIWLLDGIASRDEGKARLKAGFVTGWGFGFGYFTVSLYWIGHAFLVDAQTFAWLLPFAVTAMPAGLAIFWGLAAAAAVSLWRPGASRLFSFAAAMAIAEWLRGHIFTGFPWNAPGYAVDAVAPVAQFASVAGLYGLTLLVLLWASALAFDPDGARQRGFVIFVAVTALGVLAHGGWRLTGAVSETVPGIALRIVQPNILQKEKWQPEKRQSIVERYLELSRKKSRNAPNGIADISHLVWPESALPFLVEDDVAVRARLADLLPTGTTLLLGSLTRTIVSPTANRHPVFNSILAFDDNASVVARYNKWRLVPFGEYLPLSSVLEPLGLRHLVPFPLGFAAGDGPKTIKLAGTPAFVPLVCYEAIFPFSLLDRENRPDWLLQVTNDAWFGQSTGPHQHLAQARMRAVEEGLPLIRAANTGISAVVDPFGRILQKIDLGTGGIIDTPLPRALPATIYGRFGDILFYFFIILITVYIYFTRNHSNKI